MKNKGTEERIAEDWVFGEIISLPLAADPPKPLPEELEQKIRNWAENYGLGENLSEQDLAWAADSKTESLGNIKRIA